MVLGSTEKVSEVAAESRTALDRSPVEAALRLEDSAGESKLCFFL
jgi:hypothetical protein